MRIKIVKCSSPQSWYKDRVGEVMKVLETEEEEKRYIIYKGRLLNSFVLFDDCIVMSEEPVVFKFPEDYQSKQERNEA